MVSPINLDVYTVNAGYWRVSGKPPSATISQPGSREIIVTSAGRHRSTCGHQRRQRGRVHRFKFLEPRLRDVDRAGAQLTIGVGAGEGYSADGKPQHGNGKNRERHENLDKRKALVILNPHMPH